MVYIRVYKGIRVCVQGYIGVYKGIHGCKWVYRGI